MKHIIPIIVCSVLLFACEQYNMKGYTDYAVVNAYIMPGKEITRFMVKSPISLTDTINNNTGIENLTITMSNADTSFVLSDNGNGNYRSSHIVQPNQTYTFYFDYKGERITSSTNTTLNIANIRVSTPFITMEENSRPDFNSEEEILEITWNNTLGNYCYIKLDNISSNPDPVNTMRNNEQTDFISTPFQDNVYSVQYHMAFQYFGTYNLYVYAITDEYANLYERTSNSSSDITEPYTNIENGRGIFAAYTYLKKRITVAKE